MTKSPVVQALTAIVARYRDLGELAGVVLERYEKAPGERVLASDVARWTSSRLGLTESPWWRRKLREALRTAGVEYRRVGEQRDRYYVGLRER